MNLMQIVKFEMDCLNLHVAMSSLQLQSLLSLPFVRRNEEAGRLVSRMDIITGLLLDIGTEKREKCSVQRQSGTAHH